MISIARTQCGVELVTPKLHLQMADDLVAHPEFRNDLRVLGVSGQIRGAADLADNLASWVTQRTQTTPAR